jgi:hypothetical protein
MGADKNSSPKRELGICPKFTTKDSHTSLSKSCSHNGPTNPRSTPQTIPKRKQNSRSKGLSNSALHQADRPQALGGPSASTERTIHVACVNYLRGCGGSSETSPQTSSTAPSITDRPRRTDCPASPRGLSAKPCVTKSTRSNGSKEERTRTHEELNE